jgi:cation diffusion facilitator CzcD-associated flavoprotein CzcO
MSALKLPRVCVIGAGSSGIPVIKALHEHGIPFDAYEKSDRVGGNWVFKNKNGWSSAYRSLHINTSRARMEYADYPMPADYPDFPHHSQIAAYFEAYVDHFGLRARIQFETGVDRVTRAADGVWHVTTDRGAARTYDAVIVASGHHWDPRGPSPRPPGRWDGLEFHSHHYVDPTEPHDLRGLRVIVVGMGNSAMDIACELSRENVAAKVVLVARRGAHIVPHYWFGKPLDQLLTLPPWAPWPVKRAVGAFFHKLAVGKMTSFGLPAPDHRLGEAHPTVSSEILPRLGRGDLVVRPGITALDGKTVRFADGTTETADAIVWCTGYNVTFPFFATDFLAAPDNDLPLFHRIWRPALPSLAFVGLCQPLGAIMPIAEAQAKWIAEHLTGAYQLPPASAMEAWIARDRLAMFHRYVRSARHTMQIDFDEYLYAAARERKAGEARARASGGQLAILPRA